MPLKPPDEAVPDSPLIDMLRSLTTTPGGEAAEMVKPLVSAARVCPNVPLQSMVIDLVIVSAPKPPGSRQLISPPAAVLEIAPAKVLHGAVRLQGNTSSPTPETHVRFA